MQRPQRRTLPVVGGRRMVVAILCAGLLLASCGRGGGSRATGPTVPPGGSTPASTTTTTAVSYDVPAVIDQAYVQKVVSAHDHVLGDAIRALKRDGGVSDDFLKHLLAIYTAQEFEPQVLGWRQAVDAGDLAKRRAIPGDPITSVRRLAHADLKCITAEIDRDATPTLQPGITATESPEQDYVVLVRKPNGRDPLQLNPTPWVMSFDGFKKDGSEPVNSCDD